MGSRYANRLSLRVSRKSGHDWSAGHPWQAVSIGGLPEMTHSSGAGAVWQGATFQIALPLKEEHDEESKESQHPAGRG